MDIIKKNLWSIIWGVVALVCLIVPFWPMGSYKAELQTQADARARVYHEIKALLDQPRQAPVVDPDDPRPQDLGRFPTDGIIQASEAALGKLRNESKKLLTAAESISRRADRKLLVEGALPKGDGDTIRYKFKDQYFRSVPKALLDDIFKGGMPPTVDQITAEKALIEARMKDNSSPEEIDKAKRAVADKLKVDAANAFLMYVDPAILPRQTDMTTLGGLAPSQKAIWNAQLLYWIHEDIALAIARVNEGSKDVRTSLIKRLRRLEIETLDQDPIKWSLNQAEAKFAADKPYQPEEEIKRKPEVSMTGRVSCGLYDVIRFRLEMDVDATKLSQVLQTLSRNRFITVLAVQRIQPVDRAKELTGEAPGGGYIYGNNPVVAVIVDCEMLYLRSWTVPFMPDEVKKEYTEGPTRPH